MTAFKTYLNSRKVQKVLSKRPGEEGFSLIELVVVIAVLAILAAVAIPAFNGIQNDARASAVKSGMANGIKECLVQQARGDEDLYFDDTNGKPKAFAGDYNGYDALTAWPLGQAVNATGSTVGFDGPCMAVRATPSNTNGALPSLWMGINADGEVFKACEVQSRTNPDLFQNKFCW